MHARGDFDKIDRMVQYFDSVETLGRAGEMLRKTVVMAGKVVLWFSGLIGAWLLLSGQLTKYLGR